MAHPALTEDAVNTGAVAWVLTSAALVFLMTAGLGFFYGGLVRDTNVINTMMMSVASMAIVCLTWVVFGFSWAFGDNGATGFGMFVGNFEYSFWTNLDMKMWGDSGLPGLCFAAFQMTFAIIASAIISGSLVERMRFSAYSIMLALWSLLIYAPLCHWVWGPGGWIAEMGALDFAGGTVVHISSGVSGLVAGAIVGPRRHVEKELGPANAPFVILGGSLLWFGWLGFNGGSALSVSDGVAARAVATTFVAAASSMLSWLLLERLLKGKSSSVGASVGAVAGLVCITPGAGFVTPGWSIAIGALGAVWCYASVELVNRANLVDDTLDAFGLHGMGGIGGAIFTGIFALDGGLIYTGSFELLGKQIAGAMAGVAFSAIGTAIIVVALKVVMKLRIPEEQEVEARTDGQMQTEYLMCRSCFVTLITSRTSPFQCVVKCREDFRASRPATGGPAVLSENTVLRMCVVCFVIVKGEDCVEDVRHLVFRFQRLQSLTAQGSVDLNRLQGLEVLSLSHNQLRDLQPLSALVSLSEVNLNFNQIEEHVRAPGAGVATSGVENP
eukprot:g27206.t1